MAFLVGGGVLGCRADAEPRPVPPRPVAWTTVGRGDATQTRRFAGVVRAAARAQLSFSVPGRIARIGVDVGETFAEGAVLAELDPAKFRLEVASHQANAAQTRARLTEAEATLTRVQTLIAEGAATPAQRDAALAARDAARGQLGLASASLGLAVENLRDATLRAPFSGAVVRRHFEPSQVVATGQPVLTVQGEGRGLEVVIFVPETIVARVVVGASLPITPAAAPGTEGRAEVTEIGVDATAANAFPVTLEVKEAGGVLRPGMTVEATLALPRTGGATEPRAPTVPWSALLAGPNDTHFVFVITAENTVERRPVVVADIEGPVATVGDGLRAGERVVSGGVSFLEDGQAVQLLGDGVARYNP
ncbi:MAG: efflux RND transporter periplasmic adaptor subunit [Myxococcota bacterium]